MVDIQKARKAFETIVKSAKETAGIDLRDFDGYADLKASMMNYWEKRKDRLMTVGELVSLLQKFKENAVVCFYDGDAESGGFLSFVDAVTDKTSPYFKGDNWWHGGMKDIPPDAMVCVSNSICVNIDVDSDEGEKLKRKETDNG